MSDDFDDWQDLPLPPPLRRYIEATRQVSMDERRMMTEFAAVLCACRPWFDWRDPDPPQASCLVHTSIMFDMKGDWV